MVCVPFNFGFKYNFCRVLCSRQIHFGFDSHQIQSNSIACQVFLFVDCSEANNLSREIPVGKEYSARRYD